MSIFTHYLENNRPKHYLSLFKKQWHECLQHRCTFIGVLLLLMAWVGSVFSLFSPHLLLTIIYLVIGTPALVKIIAKNIVEFSFDIQLLMVSIAYSTLIIGRPFDGALLLVLFALVHTLEHTIQSKARQSLNDFNTLFPTHVHLYQSQGHIVDKSIQEIEIGDTLLVKAGEVIPLDGIVIQGQSSLDLSYLTGEQKPLSIAEGCTVSSGSRVVEGSLVISVTSLQVNSTVTHIISLINQAKQSRPRLQHVVHALLNRYALTIFLVCIAYVGLAPCFFAIPYLSTQGSLYRGLSFLVAASPCSFVISLSIAYLSALSAAVRRGIFLKSTALFDTLTQCQHIVFDKTGTLTLSKPTFSDIVHLTQHPLTTEQYHHYMAMIASLERYAIHPLAEAIIDFAFSRKLPYFTPSNVVSVPGQGISGTIQTDKNYTVAIGTSSFLLKTFSKLHRDDFQSFSRITHPFPLHTFCVINDQLFMLCFSETIQPSARPLLQTLTSRFHLSPHILSGDNMKNVSQVAHHLGVKDFSGQLLPSDKLEKVTALSKEGVIMVGDGINDAPAIAQATVGIVIGKQIETTLSQSADIIFFDHQLDKIEWLLTKAKKTAHIVKQNLLFSAVVIVLSSLFSIAGSIPLWLSIFLHGGGTLIAGSNSLRLLKD